MADSKLILSLLLACLAAASTQQQDRPRAVWYIKPTEDSLCPDSVPDERCNTFHTVLTNASLAEEIFTSNTILAILSGDHFLDFQSEAFLAVRNFENFTILGSPEITTTPGVLRHPSSRIVCLTPFAFAFVNVSRLAITNITVTGCGANITDDLAVEAFSTQTHGIHNFGPEMKAALLLINIHTFQMISCVVDHSLGYGLLGVNVLGDSAISRTVFYGNNNYTVLLDRCVQSPVSIPDDITACSGGNTVFVYEDLLDCPAEKTTHSLTIVNTVFALGVNGYGGLLPDQYLTRGAGLAISLAQSSYGVNVLLDTIAAAGNSALIGANIYTAIYDTVDNSTITLQNSRSENANGGLADFDNIFSQTQGSSGGLHFDYNLPTDRRNNVTAPVCTSDRKYQEEILAVLDTRFYNNVAILGAGAYFEIRTSPTNGHVARIRIERCIFAGNVGISGTSMYMSQQFNFYSQSSSAIQIRNVAMTMNRYVIPVRNLTDLYTDYQLNTLQIINLDNVTISDCNFIRNQCSGLSAFRSNLVMSGHTRFEDNSGITGGAMDIQSSHISFTPHTRVTFYRNYALLRGGAIHVQGRTDVVFPCFFLVSDLSYLPDPNITLQFEDNYAQEAGSVLYGGSIDRCIVATESSLSQNTSGEVFDYLFDIGPHRNDTSLISSDSTQVCLCVGDIPDCSLRQATVVLPAGTTLQLPVVTVGQRSGITPSTVYAVTDLNTTLDPFQLSQAVGKTCTVLNFTIRTTSQESTLVIRTSDLELSGNFMAQVKVRNCPEGFVFDSTGMCVCDPLPQLDNLILTCDIDNQTVLRYPGSWMNSSYQGPNRSYDGVQVFLNCPYDYCLPHSTDLDLMFPDTQCDHNRTGVLCGACPPGLSVTLGTSKCTECSNAYLALLIGYLVAGLALVLILFLLELTVTLGNLGGIIFYANIIQINSSIFFPPGSSNVITVFIAWLNLDTGLDICFYDGMDGYAKTWFGYAFPFYIWLIVIGIIVLSHFSARVSRLCGSRSVPVLATLMLLSYNKLLRVTIISLSSTAIVNPDGTLHLVWSYDGNQDLWKGRHIALGILAICVLLFFIIPYTMFLLLVPLPFVQRYSSRRVFSWINTLKPFTDAQQASFKSRFRNWTGILLIVRIVLSVLILVNIGSYEEEIVLLAITLAVFLVLGLGWGVGGGIHTRWPHNLLECSFLLNLGILSVVTLYVRAVGSTRQDVAILVSGSIALVLFIGILAYHFYRSLHSWKLFRKHKDKVVSSMTSKKEDIHIRTDKKELTVSYTAKTATTQSTIAFAELREPLIED